MTDLTTLRALAERVIADRARVNDAEANGEKLWCDGALLSRWMAEAASPNTILALLDRVERAEAALRLIVDMPEAPAIVSGGYADGYNGARDDAAEIARAALTPEPPQ